MKGNLFRKIEALGQQAARLQSAPGKLGQVAQAIALTSNQILDLKSGLGSSLDLLKADGEGPLFKAVQEVQEARDALAEAGFEWIGLDLELNPAPRAVLRLAPRGAADPDQIRRLVERHPERRQLNAILHALVRSSQIAERLDLGELQYREVRVGIGLMPTLQLSWRPPTPSSPAPPVAAPPVLATSNFSSATPGAASPPPAAPSGMPVPNKVSTPVSMPPGGFFESSTVPPPRAPRSPTLPSAPSAVPESTPVPTPPAAPPVPPPRWGPGALDRFKKMPGAQ